MDGFDKSNENTPDEISPENTNTPDPSVQKARFYQEKKFWIAYGVTVGIYMLLVLIETTLEGSLGLFSIILLIPYAIAGGIAWAVTLNINRRVALGLLLGGFTPFIIFFVLTGGCGLVPGSSFL